MAEAYLRENFEAVSIIAEAAIAAVNSIESKTKDLLDSEMLLISSKKKRIRRPNVISEQTQKPESLKEKRDHELQIRFEKASENKKFVEALQEKEAEIRKREEKRQKEFTDRLLKASEEQESRNKIYIKQKELEKQKLIEELELKRKKRQEDLTFQYIEGNRNWERVKKDVPLYIKLEERYNEEVLQPEKFEMQEVLAKKKASKKCPPVRELLEHARRHEQIISDLISKKQKIIKKKDIESKLYLSSISKSKFQVEIIEEQKARTYYTPEHQKKKRELLNKQKHYSVIVKEMFKPTVDSTKKHEIELRKHQKSPKLPVIKSQSENSHSVAKKRVWRKNPMVPEPPPKREPVFIDYLAERRKIRENGLILHKLDWNREIERPVSENSRRARVRLIADDIERKALQKEAKISNIGWNNRKNIEEAKDVNNLLIDSIKAKLALLDNL